MEKKLKHLEFIQGVVNRLAGNSFLVKGWPVTLVAALFALAAGEGAGSRLALVALLPVLVFWLLDGYFLWQERLFRALYNEVADRSEDAIDFKMNLLPHLAKHTWAAAAFSKTLNIFHGTLLALTALVVLLVFG